MASFVRGCFGAVIDKVTGAAAAAATTYGSARSSRVLVAVPAVVVVVIAMLEARVFAEGVRFRSINSIDRDVVSSTRGFLVVDGIPREFAMALRVCFCCFSVSISSLSSFYVTDRCSNEAPNFVG